MSMTDTVYAILHRFVNDITNSMIVGQGPTALAVGAGGGCLDIFTLLYLFSPLSPSLWEMARYRLKYCLKGPLNPKQPTKFFQQELQIFSNKCLFSSHLIQCSIIYGILLKLVHWTADSAYSASSWGPLAQGS